MANPGAYGSALEKHVFQAQASSSQQDMEAIDRPFSKTQLQAFARRHFEVQELTAPDMGFEVDPWDGKKSKAIYDNKGKLLAVLAGQPEDPGYVKAAEEAHLLMMEQGEALRRVNNGKGKSKNRRGEYDSLGCGLTHGHGTREPVNLKVQENHRPLLGRLLADGNMQRLVGNASAVLNAWAPEFYCLVEETVKKVREKDSRMQKPFDRSVYPACHFNLGPDAWCYIHRDSMNVTTGYCAVQALGRYDPKKGGHLVLWDLKMAVEFPPGSTILIMSSLLFHSSLAVGPGEERSVVTQFCPEGLVRYVESGMKTDKELCEGKTPEEKKEMLESLRKERKESRLNMVPRKEL